MYLLKVEWVGQEHSGSYVHNSAPSSITGEGSNASSGVRPLFNTLLCHAVAVVLQPEHSKCSNSVSREWARSSLLKSHSLSNRHSAFDLEFALYSGS